jgi:hypothetical protein
VSFFESIPEPPPPFEGRGLPARTRPDGVIPGSAPAGLLLIRTDKIAVALSSVRAYPNGFEFTIHARLRHDKRIVDQQYPTGTICPIPKLPV